MLVQIHTDPNIESNDTLTTRVEEAVTGAVGRFGDRVSRVQVHLEDENASKSGERDKRCMMEARLDGRPPVAVTHHADSVERAIIGAADKLERTLDSSLGRLRDR
jgi:ribosome-associated translation inhibitor RaiA